MSSYSITYILDISNNLSNNLIENRIPNSVDMIENIVGKT